VEMMARLWKCSQEDGLLVERTEGGEEESSGGRNGWPEARQRVGHDETVRGYSTSTARG
jgi:hypothetical protein